MNELSTPKVNELVRKLENYPRELTQLRRDVEKAELNLMKDECVAARSSFSHPPS